MSPHSTTDRRIAWTQRGLTKIVTDSRLSSRQRLHLSSDHDGPAPHESVRTVAGVTKIVTCGHRKSSHCRRLLQDDRNVSSVLPRPATHTRHSTHVAGDVLRTPPCPRTRRSPPRCPTSTLFTCLLLPTSPLVQSRGSLSSPEASPLTNPLKTKSPVMHKIPGSAAQQAVGCPPRLPDVKNLNHTNVAPTARLRRFQEPVS